MTTYRFGPFRLCPDQRRLEREGTAVVMTPKAFDLLVALVRHRSRAMSKHELLDLVWPGLAIEEGNLAQQILLLRRALLDAGDCIATIPRHGYHFVAPVREETERSELSINTPHCLLWGDREILLHEGINIVGRGEHANVRIPLPSVSRQHARIHVRGSEATLDDLGSRYGSWKGTMRVVRAVRLFSGDKIRFGTAELEYRLVMANTTTADGPSLV